MATKTTRHTPGPWPVSWRDGVRFGALSPPLAKQLGLPASNQRVKRWQKCADAITLLAIHGLLTAPEFGAARLRLMRDIRHTLAQAPPHTEG